MCVHVCVHVCVCVCGGLTRESSHSLKSYVTLLKKEFPEFSHGEAKVGVFHSVLGEYVVKLKTDDL